MNQHLINKEGSLRNKQCRVRHVCSHPYEQRDSAASFKNPAQLVPVMIVQSGHGFAVVASELQYPFSASNRYGAYSPIAVAAVDGL